MIGPHKNLQLGEYLFPAENICSAGLHLFPEPIQKKPAGMREPGWRDRAGIGAACQKLQAEPDTGQKAQEPLLPCLCFRMIQSNPAMMFSKEVHDWYAVKKQEMQVVAQWSVLQSTKFSPSSRRNLVKETG